MVTNKQPHWLDTEEYPFSPAYFTYQGITQHYLDVGSGEILLFVHGTPSWSFDFRNVIKTLSRSYRCIALDHIGFGLSDKPSDYPYTTQQHAQRLTNFIQFLNLPAFTLVLHDFGGPIGLKYALEHPSSITRLIILNSWLGSSEGDPDFIKLKRILKSPLLPFLYTYLNFSARFLMPTSFGHKKLPTQIRKQFTQPFQNRHERKGTVGFAHSLLNDQAWFEELYSKIDRLQKKPVLLVWGMNDPILKPSYLERFKTAFPKAMVEALEACGHFPQEEEPALTSAAIEKFLKIT